VIKIPYNWTSGKGLSPGFGLLAIWIFLWVGFLALTNFKENRGKNFILLGINGFFQWLLGNRLAPELKNDFEGSTNDS